MTRINVGIRASELNNKMLIAEHREIKRIPNCIRKGRYSLDNQPSEFKLGAGHVKFFYDKLKYLRRRYETLYRECKDRGFNVEYYGRSFDGLPKELYKDYKPTNYDRTLLQARITKRLEGK